MHASHTDATGCPCTDTLHVKMPISNLADLTTFTTDLTTGIAAGWSPPTTFTNNGWYQPGEGKWLGNTGDNTGDHNKVHEYTLSFEVNPRASLSRF